MKIAVTGANGYIGRHVVSSLLDLGHQVIAVDLSMGDFIDARAEKKVVDIFDKKINVYQAIGEPDGCIHLAWKDGFSHNSNAHMEMLSDHYSFLKKLIDMKIDHISVMGSMHEVGYYEGAIDENTPTKPLSMYGIAKNSLRQALEILTAASETTLTWLRAFYILGHDTNNNSIFSKIVKMEQEGQKTFPFVSGKNMYDFIDVEELSRQIALASIQSDVVGTINCCSGKPISLADKVDEFIHKNNFSIRPDYGKFPERPYDSPAIWGDVTKINKIIENYKVSHG